MGTEDKLLKGMDEAANEIKAIARKHQAYLTITDGIIFVGKQVGDSVRAVGLEEATI